VGKGCEEEGALRVMIWGSCSTVSSVREMDSHHLRLTAVWQKNSF
jgi:hypothetical protein